MRRRQWVSGSMQSLRAPAAMSFGQFRHTPQEFQNTNSHSVLCVQQPALQGMTVDFRHMPRFIAASRLTSKLLFCRCRRGALREGWGHQRVHLLCVQQPGGPACQAASSQACADQGCPSDQKVPHREAGRYGEPVPSSSSYLLEQNTSISVPSSSSSDWLSRTHPVPSSSSSDWLSRTQPVPSSSSCSFQQNIPTIMPQMPLASCGTLEWVGQACSMRSAPASQGRGTSSCAMRSWEHCALASANVGGLFACLPHQGTALLPGQLAQH